MKQQLLDAVLVPLGLVVLVTYHLWLLHRVLRLPTRTVMGINAINRRIWVQSMMQDPAKNGVLAVQTLRNNIMASTLLASMAIMLSSLIAVLMTNGWGSSSPTAKVSNNTDFVYGNTTDLLLSVKFFSILACFLLAFLFDVQSIRYYSHASILINVPIHFKARTGSACAAVPYLITPDHVARTLNRGSYFWSLGLRAFYFSFPLFLWIFGPIPMFVCCVVMAFLLYFLDVSDDWGENMGGGEGREEVLAGSGSVVHAEC